MSETRSFVQKVKPIYVDITGKEIKAPFISIPFPELTLENNRVNTGPDQVLTVDIFTNIITGNNVDCYLTGIILRAMDTVYWGGGIGEGFTAYLYHLTGAVTIVPFAKTYPTEINPPVEEDGDWEWYECHRFNPVIKIPYNCTQARLYVTNNTFNIIDVVQAYINYFILSFVT